MPKLEDIQSMLLSGYGDLEHARYVFFSFEQGAAARRWVGTLVTSIHTADKGKPTNTAIQVAFTYPGLDLLELSAQALNGFSREFREGIAGSDRRSRILGDTGSNAPEHWQWGGPNNPELHALLLIFANDAQTLESTVAVHISNAEAHKIGVIQTLDTVALPERKEHFGFRDGISQPKIAGISSSENRLHSVEQGEFLLGYPNERGEYTMRPVLDPSEDPGGLLEPTAESDELRDFGKHGSYLVFRQLSQDVPAFWSWAKTAAISGDAVALATKMVGRWPNGAPLVEGQTSDRTSDERSLVNDFGYHEEDPEGLQCPIGAHIRRTNPRDSLPPKPGSDDSLAINRRHRLLRRGRPYGQPLVDSLDTQGLINADADHAERGLHFLCVNADISRQFEFVQNTWANNPHFAGLYTETDPLIGARGEGSDQFSVQAEPARQRYHDLPSFIGVQGGAYFFLPSMAALTYLSLEPRSLVSAYGAPVAPAIIFETSTWTRVARLGNRLLERVISSTRRLTLLRNAADKIVQAPLTSLIQHMLLRRRKKHQIDADLAIGQEREIPGEALAIQQITQHMSGFLLKHYRERTAERAGNTKTYGLLRATFEVHDLPEELQIGVFKTPRTYDAWVRFGGPGPLATPDIRNNGVLSIGMKLLGVEGETLLGDEPGTQDFSGISAPTFTTPDVVENLKLQRYIGMDVATGYFLNPFDSHYLDMLMQGLYAKAHGSPFEASYWSCVPYLYGEGRAYKYRFQPRIEAITPVPFPAPDNYLRQAMRHNLSRADIQFDFKIQFQESPITMPIEDASIIWSSPETTVATLTITDQKFATPERDLLARQLTINPWHAMPEHRPLGNQNRARRTVYFETSRVRQRMNGESHRVPSD